MHSAARRWVADHAHHQEGAGLDLGGRDINGSVREYFPWVAWCGVDAFPGPGVDVVADAATYIHPRPVDVVLCTEVLEHTPLWPAVLATARRSLAPGGLLVATAAGPRRKPHRATGGGPPTPGEWYRNIDPGDLTAVLDALGFEDVVVDSTGFDVRCVARTPREEPL